MAIPRAVAIAWLGLALVACANAATARQPQLFPLADGNRWTLRDLDSGAATVISVRGRPGAFVLRGLPGAGVLRIRRLQQTIEAWDRSDGRWEPFLRLGAPAGTRYKVDLRGTTLWRSLEVLVQSKGAVVRDFHGKARRGCTRFTFQGQIVDAGPLELSFAPGVGPVRYSETTIGGPRAIALAGFRIRHP